ncbi:hypothetical protein WICPIJ_006796 [Wickerhamomyces pijperi]|uniref:Uncharacterized protein n=1 Tax=Wickerhamomyces pijperi TaxID=599730 RepID=A0A9P8Q1F8_WICPI|nr:hypothetical protein WICPIJ_006796 [Wickerhamomyces pijperi]
MFLDQIYRQLRSWQQRSTFFKESNISQLIFSKKGLYLLLTIFSTFALFLLSYHPARISYVSEEEIRDVPTGYRPIVERYNIDKYGKSTSLVNRCTYYFESLYRNEPNWILQDVGEGDHDSTIFTSREKFFEDRKQAARKKYSSMSNRQFEKFMETNNMVEEWDNEYELKKTTVRGAESYIVDQLTNLKVFQKCYLDHYLSESKQYRIDTTIKNPHNGEPVTCAENEKRLFPYLTGELPDYVKWDGTLISSNRLPQSKTQMKSSDCFTRFLQDSYSGKGYALDFSSEPSHVKQLNGLLLTLRLLGNKLPVEIFHNGELDQSVKDKIIEIARSDKVQLDNLESIRGLKDPKSLGLPALKSGKFLPLDIWFVDVSKTIKPETEWSKSQSSLKLLAYLFSSFEDMLLLNRNTVPMMNLNTNVLKSKEYLSKGAYFFKDRELSEPLSHSQSKFLHKLLPSEYDQKIFGVPLATAHTLNNRFFKSGFKNLQSDGVIAVNKKEHFNSILTTLSLNLWNSVKEAISHEKELFWLGFAFNGDEQYFMNKHAAGAVGETIAKKHRLKTLKTGDAEAERRNLKSTQLCSAHVGHLSSRDDHSLLWINNGMTYCTWSNPVAVEQDFSMEFINEASPEELKKKYEDPIVLKALIIPPPQERIKNSAGFEPSIGWEPTMACHSMNWCAYDSVGGVADPFYYGLKVMFGEKETQRYGVIGEAWSKCEEIVGEQ